MVGAARGEPSGCIRLCGVSKTFEDLYAQLVQIAETRPEGSGTLARLDEGVHAIGKKIVEEAAEVWMASEYQSTEEAAEEMSQLIYHVTTMMVKIGLTPEDIHRYL